MKLFPSMRLLAITVLAAVPLIVSAQTVVSDLNTGITTFASVVSLFTTTVVKATATLLLSAALVAFFFGIVQFIWGTRQGDATKAKNGKEFMLWGTIALFVMFSVYGIIKFGQGILFNGKDVTTINIPSFNFGSGGSVNTIGGGDRGISTGGGPTVSGSGGGSSGTYNPTISTAQQAFNSCIGGSGKSEAQCTSEYRAAGGTGSPTQNVAQMAYDSCIVNGNTAAECQTAYEAYKGTGSGGAQSNSLAQQAYTSCRSNGNSDSECRAAYTAYGGTGTPSGSGGAVSSEVCDAGWHAAGTGCVPNSGTSGSVTTQSCGAQGLEPNADNSACVSGSSGTDNGQEIDYGGNEDWRTSGNGYDQVSDNCDFGDCP